MPHWERSGLLPGLWIGLIGGGIEVGVTAWRRLVEGRLVYVTSDFWWLAPIVTGIGISLATVFFTALTPRRWERLRSRLRYAIPLTLATLGVVLMFSAVSAAAAGILALGVGVRGSALLVKESFALGRLVHRTAPMLLVIAASGGLGLHAAPHVMTSGRPLPDAPNHPNILLIILDTVRAIELGLYGFRPSLSPNLDGFASQGAIFDQAFSSAPWTAPSHASLFTGRPAAELSIDWNRPLDRRFPTLGEALRRQGYATVGIVGNTLYTSAETGLARGFDWYEDSHLTIGRTLLLARISRAAVTAWNTLTRGRSPVELSRVPADRVSRSFLKWVRRRPDRPFFAFLNYYDAHAPYRAPEPYWSRFLPGQEPAEVVVGAAPSLQDVARGRQAYDAAIAALDAELGQLFDALMATDAMENTLVIITADHGEEFFEHGLTGHGASLYTQSVRVPLIMVWPGQLPAGIRVADPVSLEQIAVTVLDLIGRNGPFPGQSLARYWTGEPVVPAAVRSSVSVARNQLPPYSGASGPLESVLVGPYRYIRRTRDATSELYDHRDDPMESRNLIREPGTAAIRSELQDSLIRKQ